MWNTKRNLLIFALIGFCSIVINAAQNESAILLEAKESEDLVKNDVEKKTTTTTTTTTTAAPRTTSITTTTTTTTTPKPTTTSTTTTTTPKPTTTTTTSTTPTPITTTVKPTPTPTPSIGTWNTSCVLLQMAAQLNMSYEKKDNTTAYALYNIPTDAKTYDNTCDANTNTVHLNWGSKTTPSSLMIQFDLNTTTHVFHLTTLHFDIDIIGDNFPDAKENQTVTLYYVGNLFETPGNMSYHCTREQIFNLIATIADKKPIGTIKLLDLQMEAFRTKNSTKFSAAKDCDSNSTPDVVPIAVGVALAALILIVLVSYLIARRQSTARGYMSF